MLAHAFQVNVLLFDSSPSSFTFPPPLLLLPLFFLFFSVESQSMTNRKKKGMQQVEKRSQAESCSGASATSRGESSKKNSAPEVHPQAKVGQGSSLVLVRTPFMTLLLIQLRKPSALWLRAYKAGKQSQNKKELFALQKEK